jgi:hypothetical protein
MNINEIKSLFNKNGLQYIILESMFLISKKKESSIKEIKRVKLPSK